jgi:spermidine/putrescine transport system substrate-binding protein
VTGEPVRVLAPRAALDRRRFLGVAGTAALAMTLPGCTRYDRPRPEPSASPTLGAQLGLYTWEEYSSPENLEEFTATFGPEVTLELTASNGDTIEGLQGSPGTYDVVVPTGPYVPGMIEQGLLAPLDHARIPNLANVAPEFLDQTWDPGNRYSVIKDWGSTGYVYDTTVIEEVLTSWDDFFRVAALPQVSGRVAALAENNLVDMALWRAGVDFRTDRMEDLDAAEQMLLTELAPHLAALDSYAVDGMLAGDYVLAQFWNGYGRSVVLEFPERYRWVAPTPATEIWVDHWAIVADGPNPDAAHAFLNFMLQPNIGARELLYHGYNPALLDMDQYLPFDLPARDMIFLTPEELARGHRYEVNATEPRRVEIIENVQAAVDA